MLRSFLLLLAVSSTAWAQDVPLELGATLLLKVVTYDASFEGRGSGDFVVLVPYSDDRARAEAAVQQLASVARSRIRSRTLSFFAVKGADLGAELHAKKASAILALEGTPEALLVDIARLG